VVRDLDGNLRGFYNTCRHRGHELLEPGATRNLRAIKCPYHQWVYQLDGSLGAAPRFGDLGGFDKSNYPLVTARIHEWRGWIFVNADGSAVPFEEYLGNLDGLVSAWESERLFVGASHEYVIQANWKTVTENYHECYHCPSIHPALCVVTPVESGENFPQDGLWVGGSMELKDFAETMSMTGKSGGVPIRGLDQRQLREVYYFGLFPNLLLSLHPDYIMTHRFEPLGPGQSKVECQWLFPPEAKERPDFSPEYASEFWDITNREDWLACESVYRGLQSEGFRQGRSPGARTRCTSSWPWSPRATWTASRRSLHRCTNLTPRPSDPAGPGLGTSRPLTGSQRALLHPLSPSSTMAPDTRIDDEEEAWPSST
jgi:glycine betaine catabolism A